MKKPMILLTLFFITAISHISAEEHKLIYLISSPRSLSTAFLRMMESRGDCEVFNEPSMYAYDRIQYTEKADEWFSEDAPKSFDEVKTQLYESLNKHHVFVKEMCFPAHQFLPIHTDFVSDGKVHFLILIRDPHHTSISLYKKCFAFIDELSDEVFSSFVGLKQLWEVFQTVKQHASNPIKVLLAHHLYENPEETVQELNRHLGIPHLKKSLAWKPYDNNFTGQQEWHEIKKSEHAHHWHGDALKSSGFVHPTAYAVDSLGEPTFSEIINPKHREMVKKAYKENLPYYRKFQKFLNDNN